MTPAPAPDTRGSSRSPAAGWVAVGFGAVGVGVGTYFGLRALSQQKDADRYCDGDRCSPFGASQNAEAIRSANLSTVGFSVGLVGLGVGAYLLLTGGRSVSRAAATSASVSAQVSVNGVALKGSF
jgi:hypothetical protein